VSWVGVDVRVEMVDAELWPQSLDFVLRSSQKVPAGAHAVSLRVRLENPGAVMLGIERDREKCDVSPGPPAEELLRRGQMRGAEGAGVPAGREHEVDRDDFALHKVVVEPYRLAL